MFASLLAAAVVLTQPGVKAGDDAPLLAIGLPFENGTPVPVSPDHPLYRRVSVDPIGGMPATVGGTIFAAAKRSSVQKALAATLDRMNLLAPDPAQAKARLATQWGGLETPVEISMRSHATARLTYVLTRIDSGKELFRREIVTSTEASGGDGSQRLIGNGRMAVAVNLASMAGCLDRAAYGQAPDDCALRPAFAYKAPRPATIMFLPIRR